MKQLFFGFIFNYKHYLIWINADYYVYLGIAINLLEYVKIAEIGNQKNETMHPVKSLLDCKNREQDCRETEHDGNIPEEQVGRHGKRDKKTAESKHHDEVE